VRCRGAHVIAQATASVRAMVPACRWWWSAIWATQHPFHSVLSFEAWSAMPIAMLSLIASAAPLMTPQPALRGTFSAEHGIDARDRRDGPLQAPVELALMRA